MAGRKAIKELIDAAEQASAVLDRYAKAGSVDAVGAKFLLDMALFEVKPTAERRRIQKATLASA